MRMFRITNISGSRNVPRTSIPVGKGALVPGTPQGRRRIVVKRGAHTRVVSEDQLRCLQAFYTRSQMQVWALDGKPLPGWLTGVVEKETPAALVMLAAESSIPEPPQPSREDTGPTVEQILEYSARDIVEEVQKIGYAAAMEMLELESAKEKPRKTVVNALNARLQELQDREVPDGSEA